MWSALFAAMLRYATPLIFAALGGLFSERSGVINIALEGMLLMGAFFAVLGADLTGSWFLGLLIGMVAGGAAGADPRGVRGDAAGRPDRLRHGAELPRARHHELPVPEPLRRPRARRRPAGGARREAAAASRTIPFFGDIFGQVNLLIWIGLLLVVVVVGRRVPHAAGAAAALGRREPAGGRDGRPVGGQDALRRGRARRACWPAPGGAYLSIGFVHSFSQNMTIGKGFIALAALIFGRWRPGGALAAALLFGFSSALAQRLPVFSPVGGDAVPGAAVRADADRGRRRDRPLDPAGGARPPARSQLIRRGRRLRTSCMPRLAPVAVRAGARRSPAAAAAETTRRRPAHAHDAEGRHAQGDGDARRRTRAAVRRTGHRGREARDPRLVGRAAPRRRRPRGQLLDRPGDRRQRRPAGRPARPAPRSASCNAVADLRREARVGRARRQGYVVATFVLTKRKGGRARLRHRRRQPGPTRLPDPRRQDRPVAPRAGPDRPVRPPGGTTS